MSKYARFGAMVATSTLVMFGLMYLNTYELSHVWFSETRAYMALVMGATMAPVMLAFMRQMCGDRRAKITDPRVRKLADGIIAAQRKEIVEMEALIRELAR